MYNFDELIDRSNTISYKWDKYTDPHVIPLWVADMDFKSPPPILNAINKITANGILGYAYLTDELLNIVVDRLKKIHHWEVKKEWVLAMPGLVPGLYAAAHIAGNVGDSILTSTPVYTHLVDAINYTNRQKIDVPLINELGNYYYDFAGIREKTQPNSKMLFLCNPHNPTGRVFSKAELEQLADICVEKNLIVCSDEIHSDLIIDRSKTHISIASLSKAIENQSITFISPSKTFNIAGLGCSFAIIPNEEIREKFIRVKHGMFPMIGPFAYAGALAAYQNPECEIWRQELLDYLKINHDYLLREINQINGIRMNDLNATYLAWIDVSATKIPNISHFLEQQGVGIMDAKSFHAKDFIRLNFGTPKSRLEEAVYRIKKAFA